MCRPVRRRRHCRHCGFIYDHCEEDGLLRRGWCSTCETNWLEPRLRRLVCRIGRKAAVRALKALTS